MFKSSVILVSLGCLSLTMAGGYPESFSVGYGFVTHGGINHHHGHYLPSVAHVKVHKDPFQSHYALDEEGPTHYKYVRHSSSTAGIVSPLVHHHHHTHGYPAGIPTPVVPAVAGIAPPFPGQGIGVAGGHGIGAIGGHTIGVGGAPGIGFGGGHGIGGVVGGHGIAGGHGIGVGGGHFHGGYGGYPHGGLY